MKVVRLWNQGIDFITEGIEVLEVVQINHGGPAPSPNTVQMFSGLPPLVLTEHEVHTLASAMSLISGGQSEVDAGHVYFGQFIAHDLSAVSRFVADGTAEPTPGLDLDTLYTRELSKNARAMTPQTGKFRFRGTAEDGGLKVDLPRDFQRRKAQIEDDRNDENLLTAQMQVFWMKLHNHFLRKVKSFELARKLTTAVYQNSVVEEFLSNIIHPKVFRSVCREGKRILPWDSDITQTKIPIEFAGAAFRFGHSMVRSDYLLKTRQSKGLHVGLSEFFDLTGKTGMRGGWLPLNRVVDWHEFFDLSSHIDTNKANKIDPKIVSQLRNIENVQLAKKNLESGSTLSLPSGQALAGAVKALIPEQSELSVTVFDTMEAFESARYYGKSSKQKEISTLSMLKMFDQTPLWYYLLAEDFMENPGVASRGNHLGTLGSILVAETIHTLLMASRFSILRDDKHHIEDARGHLSDSGEIDPVMTSIMGARILE